MVFPTMVCQSGIDLTPMTIRKYKYVVNMIMVKIRILQEENVIFQNCQNT